MKENQFFDEDKHTNMTQLPNLLDDMKLSPFAVRIYLHIKRRAGDNGGCFESSKKMAKHCMMSEGKVSDCKRELERAGLIRIETIRRGHGEFDYHRISIKDIWEENFLWFSLRKEIRDDAILTQEHNDRDAINALVIEGRHWDGSKKE